MDDTEQEARAARAEARRKLAEAGLVHVKFGRIEDMDRSFDIDFWQAQTTTARMNAAWELVEDYLIRQGCADELRMQKSVARYGRCGTRGRRVCAARPTADGTGGPSV